MKIVLKGVPPSLNRFAGRANTWAWRAEKSKWTQAVQMACIACADYQKHEKALVRIDYFFADARRRDPDNYGGKFLLDGLTKAGVIADDDFSHIALSVHGHVDRDDPRTEIRVVNMCDA